MISSILRFLSSAALVFVCLTTFAVSPPPKEGGQTPSATKSPTATPKPTPAGAIDEKLFSGMQWRQIGPFRGGRALAIEGVPGEPDTYYFGGVAGGVWKTVDGGQNWTPLFDKAPIAATPLTESAFTNRSMRARPGKMSDSETAAKSAR